MSVDRQGRRRSARENNHDGKAVGTVTIVARVAQAIYYLLRIFHDL